MIHATPNFGMLLVALAAIIVLGLLALLVFLVVARHRMLSFVVLGFVLLFIGLPVLLFVTASRKAVYRVRQAAEYEQLQHMLRAEEARARAWNDAERQRARVLEMQVLQEHPLLHPSAPTPPAPPSPPNLTEASATLELIPATESAAISDATAAGAVAEISTQDELLFWQLEDQRGESAAELVAAAETPLPAASEAAPPALPGKPGDDPVAVAAVARATGTNESTAPTELAIVTDIQPAWVQNPPSTVEKQPAEVLVSDLFETRDECEQDLKHRIQAAIETFAERHCRQRGMVPKFPLPIQTDDLRQVSRDRFVDVVPTSVGPMRRVHQLVVFDADFCRVLDRRVSEAVIGQRLSQTGAFSGSVLLLVGSLFGILKGASRRRSKVASA